MIIAYVAGPFRAATGWGIAENVRRAERVALAVSRAGAMPLTPHSIGANFHGEGDDKFWLDGTMELLRRCDVIVCTEDWTKSSGARAEVDEAVKLGIPVHLYRAMTAAGETEERSADERLREFLTTVGAGSAQWSRYAGDKVRSMLPTMRKAAKADFKAAGLAPGVAQFTITANAHLLPAAEPVRAVVDLVAEGYIAGAIDRHEGKPQRATEAAAEIIAAAALATPSAAAA